MDRSCPMTGKKILTLRKETQTALLMLLDSVIDSVSMLLALQI